MGNNVRDTVFILSDATEALMERIIAERDALPPNTPDKVLLRHLGRHIDHARMELQKAVRYLEEAE